MHHIYIYIYKLVERMTNKAKKGAGVQAKQLKKQRSNEPLHLEIHYLPCMIYLQTVIPTVFSSLMLLLQHQFIYH